MGTSVIARIKGELSHENLRKINSLSYFTDSKPEIKGEYTYIDSNHISAFLDRVPKCFEDIPHWQTDEDEKAALMMSNEDLKKRIKEWEDIPEKERFSSEKYDLQIFLMLEGLAQLGFDVCLL